MWVSEKVSKRCVPMPHRFRHWHYQHLPIQHLESATIRPIDHSENVQEEIHFLIIRAAESRDITTFKNG